MFNKTATLIGTIAALGIIAATTAASASPAVATNAVNVRSGPGTSFGVVDTLTPGENVNVTECATNGWCHIQHPGPDGWVSGSYLTAGSGGGAASSDPDCGFGLNIGPGGPSFSIHCGDSDVAVAPPAPTPPAPPAPATPSTFSTGPISLKQTWQANLDNGNVGGGGADIWYQAVTPVKKYITPRNGAKIAVGDRSNRGFAGCSVESFSGSKVPLAAIPVGSYVCVKTNKGRISQFRVNGFSGTTMKLGYTTWSS